MPVTRKFVSQDQEECQILKMDSNSIFIVNDSEEWQFLFNPYTTLTNSSLQLKIATQFNTDTFDGIKIIAYLYESQTGSIASLGSCTFSIYKIQPTDWEDIFIDNFIGTILPNSYFYKAVTSSELSNLALDGETTIMIEATGIRLGTVYRNRIYVNHLGVYDSILSLKKDIQYLDATKQDE